jgi:hypothetical protein
MQCVLTAQPVKLLTCWLVLAAKYHRCIAWLPHKLVSPQFDSATASWVAGTVAGGSSETWKQQHSSWSLPAPSMATSSTHQSPGGGGGLGVVKIRRRSRASNHYCRRDITRRTALDMKSRCSRPCLLGSGGHVRRRTAVDWAKTLPCRNAGSRACSSIYYANLSLLIHLFFYILL